MLVQDLHWYFFAGHCKPSICIESPHFWHLSLVLVNILGIKAFLVIIVVVWGYLLPVTCIILVTWWSRFQKDFFCLCLLAGRSVCFCGIILICATLGVTGHLLDMPGSHLWTLHLPCKLPDLVCGKLVQVYVAIIYCPGDKLFIFQEVPKMSLWSILAVSGVLSQSNLGLDRIIPLIHWLVSLQEACEKIKPSPHFIWLRLEELF